MTFEYVWLKIVNVALGAISDPYALIDQDHCNEIIGNEMIILKFKQSLWCVWLNVEREREREKVQFATISKLCLQFQNFRGLVSIDYFLDDDDDDDDFV